MSWNGLTGLEIKTYSVVQSIGSTFSKVVSANPARVGLAFGGVQGQAVVLTPVIYSGFNFYGFTCVNEGLWLNYDQHGPIVCADWYANASVWSFVIIETLVKAGGLCAGKT